MKRSSLPFPHHLLNMIMDGVSTVDGTTVINGPASASGSNKHDSYPEPTKSAIPARPDPHMPPPNAKLMHTADYLLADRPFFVSIGKDGLIAALQKLNRQLKEVRVRSTLAITVSDHIALLITGWVFFDPVEQGSLESFYQQFGFRILISSRSETNRLDRQRNPSRSNRSHQPWWPSKVDYPTGTISWFPPSELVGEKLAGHTRM